MEDVDECLTDLAIETAFRDDGYYRETVESGDDERVDQLRRRGRAIARRLGCKVRTTAEQSRDGDTVVSLEIAARQRRTRARLLRSR